MPFHQIDVVYHVEVVLCACPSQQVPYENISIMARRQNNPGVKWVRLKDKHFSLMALETRFIFIISMMLRLIFKS